MIGYIGSRFRFNQHLNIAYHKIEKVQIMTFEFPDKVVLITGGASGLGRASALAFTHAGAEVVISDQNKDGGAETIEMIHAAGGSATFMQIDVTDEEAVADLIAQTVSLHGRIDFAVNSAGISGDMAPMADYPVETFKQVMDVNVSGVWHCMQHQIIQMLKQDEGDDGRGIIVNLASVAGVIGAPRLSAYVASKHAVVGLTKSVALEYVRKGIRINAICPGFTDTPMVQQDVESDPAFAEKVLAGIPARRLGKPEEIAAAILYLCSPAAAFTVGHAMVLDGGISAG